MAAWKSWVDRNEDPPAPRVTENKNQIPRGAKNFKTRLLIHLPGMV